MSPDEGIAELLERALNGDGAALRVLLTVTRDGLRHYVELKIPPEWKRVIDAEDIVQDAHVQVFRRLDRLTARDSEAFRRWTAAIAVNGLRNVLRKHKAIKRGGGKTPFEQVPADAEQSTVALLDMLAGPGRTPSQSVARVEAVSAVQGALDELPQEYREAIWLVYIEGRSSQDAAERLGRTDGAVRGLCRRGLKLLKQHLESATNSLSAAG